MYARARPELATSVKPCTMVLMPSCFMQSWYTSSRQAVPDLSRMAHGLLGMSNVVRAPRNPQAPRRPPPVRGPSAVHGGEHARGPKQTKPRIPKAPSKTKRKSSRPLPLEKLLALTFPLTRIVLPFFRLPFPSTNKSGYCCTCVARKPRIKYTLAKGKQSGSNSISRKYKHAPHHM